MRPEDFTTRAHESHRRRGRGCHPTMEVYVVLKERLLRAWDSLVVIRAVFEHVGLDDRLRFVIGTEPLASLVSAQS